MLFGNVHFFKAISRAFMIPKGFEIKKIKNQGIRVIARCVTKEYPCRIDGSLTVMGCT